MNFSKDYTHIRLTASDREASVPGIGPWYWLPKPDGTFLFKAYAVNYKGGDPPDHEKYFDRVISYKIADLWRKPSLRDEIQGLTYSIPRGRVAYIEGMFYIHHGDDSPVPNWFDKVKSEFNLESIFLNHPNRIKISKDGHERMLSDQKRRIESILSINIPAQKEKVTNLW